jgi:uncharacterized protein (DUF849 family)
MKTIITCAVTGGKTDPNSTPYLPITPEQIAQSSLDAAKAGASIVHIHVRNPDNGKPSMDKDLYQKTVDLIRNKNENLIINLTTGPGAVYKPLTNDNSGLVDAQTRVEHIDSIRPDICSLDFNTMMQDDDGVRINSIPVIAEMLLKIQSYGTLPEFEIFDSGDLRIAKKLIGDGLTSRQPIWQIVTGVRYGWESSIDTIDYALKILPENSIWCALGVGKMSLPIAEYVHQKGGHVRVGMEDNIYLEKNVLAKSNAELVEQCVSSIEKTNGSVASVSEARSILKI